jgi:hypothetical protein
MGFQAAQAVHHREERMLQYRRDTRKKRSQTVPARESLLSPRRVGGIENQD